MLEIEETKGYFYNIMSLECTSLKARKEQVTANTEDSGIHSI